MTTTRLTKAEIENKIAASQKAIARCNDAFLQKNPRSLPGERRGIPPDERRGAGHLSTRIALRVFPERFGWN